MSKMDPKAKKKWLKALRSGDYCQTQGTLVDETGYCCLGVLAEVCGLKKDWTVDKHDTWRYKGFPGGWGSSCWFGVDTDAHAECVDMNDSGAGKSFKQIANWVEENL